MKQRKDPTQAAGSSVEQCRIPRAKELVEQGFHRMLIQFQRKNEELKKKYKTIADLRQRRSGPD